MQHPYLALQAEYERYVATVRPLPNRVAEIDAVAKRLINPASLANYQQVQDAIGVPIVVDACICEREDGNDFTKNPSQGDAWNRASIHVPKNRGPFSSWVAAAIDAFSVCDHLNDNSAPWSLPYACWKFESYNGFGYRAHGIHSPYVVGGTNLQQPGKYIGDGDFDPSVMDTQLGCLPIAMRMIELSPDLAFGLAIAAMPAPTVMQNPLPTPASAGAGLVGTKWLQSAINLIMQPATLLEIDGSFGRATRAAIRDYQAARNMVQNGLIDTPLCDALSADLNKMRPA